MADRKDEHLPNLDPLKTAGGGEAKHRGKDTPRKKRCGSFEKFFDFHL